MTIYKYKVKQKVQLKFSNKIQYPFKSPKLTLLNYLFALSPNFILCYFVSFDSHPVTLLAGGELSSFAPLRKPEKVHLSEGTSLIPISFSMDYQTIRIILAKITFSISVLNSGLFINHNITHWFSPREKA